MYITNLSTLNWIHTFHNSYVFNPICVFTSLLISQICNYCHNDNETYSAIVQILKYAEKHTYSLSYVDFFLTRSYMWWNWNFIQRNFKSKLLAKILASCFREILLLINPQAKLHKKCTKSLLKICPNRTSTILHVILYFYSLFCKIWQIKIESIMTDTNEKKSWHKMERT